MKVTTGFLQCVHLMLGVGGSGVALASWLSAIARASGRIAAAPTVAISTAADAPSDAAISSVVAATTGVTAIVLSRTSLVGEHGVSGVASHGCGVGIGVDGGGCEAAASGQFMHLVSAPSLRMHVYDHLVQSWMSCMV